MSDTIEGELHVLQQRVKVLEMDVSKLIRAGGAPGTGACICKASPESVVSNLARMHEKWETNAKSRFPSSAMLDHRCPKHGEKAQPAVWGRHKEKELLVTYAQWSSLGVTHEEPKT